MKTTNPPSAAPAESDPHYQEIHRRNLKSARARQRRNLLYGLGFLAPNILGFLAFIAIPLVFSMVLAFSNWDLKLHNMFKPESHFKFVGLDNFMRLFRQADFWRFLGNTLFLMIGMPFSIAGSLMAAMLLSKDPRGGSGRVWLALIGGAILVASAILLTTLGMGGSAMLLLLGGVTCAILVGGTIGGNAIYRTLFYLPNFTAGVATYLLWKKLYSPTGPVNAALAPPLDQLSHFANTTGSGLWQVLAWVCVGLFILFFAWGVRRICRQWEEGDLGRGAALLAIGLTVIPVVTGLGWFNVVDWSALSPVGAIQADQVASADAGSIQDDYVPSFVVNQTDYFSHVRQALVRNNFSDNSIALTQQAIGSGRNVALVVLAGSLVALIWNLVKTSRIPRLFRSRSMEGVGSSLMLGASLMVALMVLLGLAGIGINLTAWASHESLQAPKWLTDMQWAKPALIIMGFWAAVGSNTMLLYLAALTNVPQELYEAAGIDGASRFQKFWNVTWPQLAPTTFFVVVMGVIGGLQGGFEMAQVMTLGGPAGQTTTLAYFIYTEGFETGRLGYSSAVAWALFLMVLLVTLFNWKFGNKYVND